MTPLNEKLNKLEAIARAALTTIDPVDGRRTTKTKLRRWADFSAAIDPPTALSLIEAVRARDRAIEVMRLSLEWFRASSHPEYVRRANEALAKVEEILK